MGNLHLLDAVLLVVYLGVVVGIGVWANRRQHSTEDYLLAGRRLGWWAVGVSLIATSFSSAALIGGTGFGFARGMAYLQLQLGDLLAVGIAIVLFIPFFSRLGLTTAYEYLEQRFGVVARTAASILFIAQTCLRAGILVYGPALAITAILGWPIEGSILVSGVAALLYSATGGLAAVVWTDMIQMAVVVLGVVFCLVVADTDVAGGLGAVLDHAWDAGRLHTVDLGVRMDSPFHVVGALAAYGTLAISIACTNQQAVQRYLSCRDARSAKLAALTGWGIGFVAVALTLFLGASLFAWSALAPGGEVLKEAGDQALPLFIKHRLPPGISGLLIAAIFAASMSSMDSAIHAMSTATLVDFVRRFRRVPLAPRAELRMARALTVAFGVLATGVAIYAAQRDTALLDTLITWLGYFAGPLLGLFLLGLLDVRANEQGALVGLAAGGAGVVAAVVTGLPAELGLHPLWLAPAALLVTVLLGVLASRAFPAPARARVEGLTWAHRPRRPRA